MELYKTINKWADIKEYLFAENSELLTVLVVHLNSRFTSMYTRTVLIIVPIQGNPF